MFRSALAAALAGALALPGAACASVQEASQRAAPASVLGATKVAKLTGKGSINRTANKYQVMATDLGVMWDNGRGQVMTAFGDTYGEGWDGNGSGPRTADWRCNTLALSSDRNLADGMSFDTMIQDTPGHAKQLIDCEQQTNIEETVIPTAGVTVGDRSYIHYMSVNHWGAAGHWYTNHSGIAYSDDNGQTWTESDLRWDNTDSWDAPFQMASFVERGGFVYMFGTGNGRFGPARLARVPKARMLDKSAYQYWTGSGWRTDDPRAAVPVVPAPVSELSVSYNNHLDAWVMLYLDENRHAIVLRRADRLTGTWSGEHVVTTAGKYPQLYGSFIHPWSDGQQLYFTMSQWAPYNVFLMRTDLRQLGANTVSDPGFEEQPGSSVSAPWKVSGAGGVDRGAGYAHSGANNAWLRNTDGWNDVHQRVAVRPHHTYRLTGWVRTSASNTDGYFGVRATDGTVIEETTFASLPGYTKLTVQFNSGSHSLVDIFAGMWAHGSDTWVRADDFTLTEVG